MAGLISLTGSSFLTLFLSFLALLPVVAEAQVDQPLLARGEIAGSIRFYGCTPSPNDFALRAVPARAYVPGEDRNPPPVREGRAVAQLSATPDPHVLRFQISSVVSGHPYRLQATMLPPNPCGRKLVWQMADRGHVIADQSPTRRPVQIQAFAIRSHLEISGNPVGRRARAWVGADHLDFTDPAAGVRTLRFSTDLAGVTHGLLQIATEKFPTGNDLARSCEARAKGLLYERSFALPALQRGGWAELPNIDFYHIVAQSGRSGTYDAPPMHPATYQMLLMGAPLYVRVIPIEARSGSQLKRCDPLRDGIPSITIFAKVPSIKDGKIILPPPPAPPPPPPMKVLGGSYNGPTIDPAHPKKNETCYKAIKPHTLTCAKFGGGWCESSKFPDYHLIQPIGTWWWGETIKKGYSFCIAESSGDDDSWWEEVLDAVGDAISAWIDAIGTLVTDLSNLYDSIKEGVVKAVAGVMKELKIGCDEKCMTALQFGLEVGLAAVGAPPSLPNWDELVDEGIDYVAAIAAEQTGLPSPVVAESLKIAKETVKQMKANGSGSNGLPDWLATDFRMSPAVLTLVLKQTDPYQDLPQNALLFHAENEVFMAGILPLPRRLPPYPPESPIIVGRQLTLPMVLAPDISDLPSPPPDATEYESALHYKKHWTTLFHSSPCVHHEFAGGEIVFVFPLPTYQLGYLNWYPDSQGVEWVGPKASWCGPKK